MDEQHRLAERLRTVRHFQHLGLTDLLHIVSSGQVLKFHSGNMVFHEGEPCSGMFVLLKGQVQLEKAGPQGQTSILSTINPVIMFNEVAVLDGGPNPFSAHAVHDCVIWKISYDAFKHILNKHPQIGLGLLKVLAKRNRQMIEQYEDVSFRPVLARVAKLLLDLSEHGKRTIQRNEHPINQLAARIASVPEVISRSLNTFKTQELIEYNRVEIQIIEPDELAKQAQIDTPFVS